MRVRNLVQIAASLVIVGVGAPATGKNSLTAEVEATVRGFESAYQHEPSKTAGYLLPDAKWIEGSYPLPAADPSQWRKDADAAGLQITSYETHDFVTHVHGDFAWVTVTLEGGFEFSDSDAGRKLMGWGVPGQRRWRQTFVESYVLVKTNTGWRIALAHTTGLPHVGQ